MILVETVAVTDSTIGAIVSFKSSTKTSFFVKVHAFSELTEIANNVNIVILFFIYFPLLLLLLLLLLLV